jgi:lysozyme family protein
MFDGDSLPSQAVAEELFDTAVNMGVGTAVKFLQEALCLLDRSTEWFAIDGHVGPQTRRLLAAQLASRDGERRLLKAMNALQGARYLELARNSPSQERFLAGWLERT